METCFPIFHMLHGIRPISLFPLVLIGLCVLWMIITCLARGRCKRPGRLRSGFPFVPVLMVIVVVVGFLPTTVYVKRSNVEHIKPWAQQKHRNAEYSPGPRAIWTQGLDERFDADIYPSPESAGACLGRRMGRTLREQGLDLDGLSIEVSCSADAPDPVTSEAVARFIEQMEDHLQHARVEHIASRRVVEFPSRDAIHMALEHRDGNTLQARFEMLRGDTMHRARHHVMYKQAPWLDQPSVYLNACPQHAIARSRESCIDEIEARQEARQEAERLIEQHLSHRSGSLSLPDPIDFCVEDFQEDVFLQGLEGSAGRIWRCAILLDFSEKRLQPAVRIHAHRVSRIHDTWKRQIFSGLILGFVLFLLYLFLNAATRGYYTMTMRITLIVLAIAGGVMILMTVS